MNESPCQWELGRFISEAVSKVLVHFPMFSCQVVEAGLDFLQTYGTGKDIRTISRAVQIRHG